VAALEPLSILIVLTCRPSSLVLAMSAILAAVDRSWTARHRTDCCTIYFLLLTRVRAGHSKQAGVYSAPLIPLIRHLGLLLKLLTVGFLGALRPVLEVLTGRYI